MVRSYTYGTLNRLPRRPGVYILKTRNRSGSWTFQYVGLSNNLHRRWNATGERAHGHKQLFKATSDKSRLVVSTHWEHNLRFWEAQAIRQCNPKLNIQIPKPLKHLSILVVLEVLWILRIPLVLIAILTYLS